MKVLNIEVSETLLATWQGWLAPGIQPFFLTNEEAADLPPRKTHPNRPVLRGIPPTVPKLHALRATFEVFNVDTNLLPVWLAEAEFMELPKQTRARIVRAQVAHRRGAVPTVQRWADLLDANVLRSQADGHRFVWWPSLVATRPSDILQRVVADSFPPSKHKEVSAKTWTRCAKVLPEAKRLAGTFAGTSGPNCFGTVMTAAGVANIEDAWVFQDPFEEWLNNVATPGGDDQTTGTVLVWRNTDNLALHAAVTIGDGWALEKPSQAWLSPRAILPVAEIIRAGRRRGVHLARYSLAKTG